MREEFRILSRPKPEVLLEQEIVKDGKVLVTLRFSKPTAQSSMVAAATSTDFVDLFAWRTVVREDGAVDLVAPEHLIHDANGNEVKVRDVMLSAIAVLHTRSLWQDSEEALSVEEWVALMLDEETAPQVYECYNRLMTYDPQKDRNSNDGEEEDGPGK